MITHQRTDNNSYHIDRKNNIFDVIRSRITSKELGSTVIVPYACYNDTFSENGFNGLLSKNYPIVKENFLMLSKQSILGKTQFIEISKDKQYGHSLIIASMICQKNKNKHSRSINYAALCYCMTAISNKCQELKKNSETHKIEIHCPKFGTGFAGGDWKFISFLIDDLWSSIDTYVYFNK